MTDAIQFKGCYGNGIRWYPAMNTAFVQRYSLIRNLEALGERKPPTRQTIMYTFSFNSIYSPKLHF